MTITAPKIIGSLPEEADWDKYTLFRPKYPDSLEKLIIDHHRVHSNSFRLAHDIGSGTSAFAIKLAEYFRHVHVSESKTSSLDQVRQKLDQWFAENWWKARFTFSVTPTENAHEAAARGSVDLVTLMQCAHWTDQDALVKSVANSLAPNGTLAIVHINPAPNVIDNGAVKEAVDRLFEFWADNMLEAKGGRDSLIGTRYLPQSNAGTECVAVPEHLFTQETVKRIEINVNERGRSPHAIPGHETLLAPSRADPQHERFEYEADDAEGAGWRYEVGPQWFRGLIGTLEQKSRLPLYERHLREIERLVKETSAIGIVEIEWTVSLLLATRK